MKNMDLTWTGNLFLDGSKYSEAMLASADGIDVTTKEDVWSEKLVLDIEKHFKLAPGCVRAAAGATQIIDAMLRGMYRGRVVDVTPNFHLTATVARQEGWNYVSVPVRHAQELEASLAPFLDSPETTIVLCSPRNPLAYQFPVDRVHALVRRSEALVIVDEVYADFAQDSLLRVLDDCPNLIVVRTFSKAWGLASLRVGFAAGMRLAGDKSALRLIPNAVSGVSQRAARRALREPSAVQDSILCMRACRTELASSLSATGQLHVWPSDANYLCIETPLADRMAAALGAAGYDVRKLHDLSAYPANWPMGLRITVPPAPHAERIAGLMLGCLPASWLHAPVAAVR